MKFMFIDSSTKGQNAKPDKAVRSFVMHQARRNKPWSTRQRNAQSPNTDTARAPTPRAQRPSPTLDRAEGRNSPVGPSWLNDLDPSPTTWNQVQVQPLGSPVSSVGGDSTTSRSASQPYSTPPSSHGSVCDVPNCHGDTCSHQTQALTRRDGFALGVLDPFDCLAVKTDAKTSSLIDHFVSIISPRLIPVDLYQVSTAATTGWVARSLGDRTSAPFAYTLLTSSALHLQGVGATNVENPLFYKAQAISEVNKLLSDPITMVDDNNIAAVFMLLCLEESQIAPGNKSHDDTEWSEMQRAIHLNGLRTMIQQRGGLSGLNKCLQVFLLMHSIAHSIASFQQPYTTLLDSTGFPQKYDLPSFRSRPSSSRVLRLFRDMKPDSDLLDIIDNIVVFVGDLSAWYEDRKCPLDPLELQKHVYLLIYRLFHWYSQGEAERTPLDQSICLGLLVFLVRAGNGYDPSYKAIILLTVKKLRGALSKGSIFGWANSPDLLLWTLTMGALAAQGTSEAGFFTQYCSVAFADAGLDSTTSVDELLKRMKKCLWIPLLFDEDVKKLWIQIGLAKGGEKKAYEVQEGGLLSPDLKEDDVVGLLTSTRFFTNNK
ncbi:hypothetical protein BDV96DRAFT_492097 [Lophiotrema nucula]|uniref:Fungal-specific transcription factor domain-containing protein n=1 Tax=Lophiotrema nucula TaxID=690887 RepID=A0A6A5ZAB2_9PLEO|nr:hypothetical protein BDV96DRAFT_492097 [Lophiotrema nucula]